MKIKCAKCGYLSLRSKNDCELVEADREFRETGNSARTDVHDEWPYCFVNAIVFQGVINTPDSRNRRIVLNEARECSKFVEWRGGYSPREHLEAREKAEAEKVAAQQKQKEDEKEESQERMRFWTRDVLIKSIVITAILVPLLTWLFNQFVEAPATKRGDSRPLETQPIGDVGPSEIVE